MHKVKLIFIHRDPNVGTLTVAELMPAIPVIGDYINIRQSYPAIEGHVIKRFWTQYEGPTPYWEITIHIKQG